VGSAARGSMAESAEEKPRTICGAGVVGYILWAFLGVGHGVASPPIPRILPTKLTDCPI
jgi:hypothetical protein